MSDLSHPVSHRPGDEDEQPTEHQVDGGTDDEAGDEPILDDVTIAQVLAQAVVQRLQDGLVAHFEEDLDPGNLRGHIQDATILRVPSQNVDPDGEVDSWKGGS